MDDVRGSPGGPRCGPPPERASRSPPHREGRCRPGRALVLAAGRLKGPGSRPFPRLPEGTETLPAIDHIVVVMMENHSFDNVLGMLRAPAGPRGRRPAGSAGGALNANPDAQGATRPSRRTPTACQVHGAPSQAWNASHIAYDGGRNDGFVRASGPVAMRYFTAADLPVHPLAGPALPGRRALLLLVLGPDLPELPLPADGHVERRDPDRQLDLLDARPPTARSSTASTTTGSAGRTTTTASLRRPSSRRPAARAPGELRQGRAALPRRRGRGAAAAVQLRQPATTSRSPRRTRRTSSSATASWPA